MIGSSCTNNLSEVSVFSIVYWYPLFSVIGSSWYTPDPPAPLFGIKTATFAHLEVAEVKDVEFPVCRAEAYIDRAIERVDRNRVQAPVMRIDAPHTTTYAWTTSWQTHWRFV